MLGDCPNVYLDHDVFLKIGPKISHKIRLECNVITGLSLSLSIHNIHILEYVYFVYFDAHLMSFGFPLLTQLPGERRELLDAGEIPQVDQ